MIAVKAVSSTESANYDKWTHEKEGGIHMLTWMAIIAVGAIVAACRGDWSGIFGIFGIIGSLALVYFLLTHLGLLILLGFIGVVILLRGLLGDDGKDDHDDDFSLSKK